MIEHDPNLTKVQEFKSITELSQNEEILPSDLSTVSLSNG